jgi:hypothetical protein
MARHLIPGLAIVALTLISPLAIAADPPLGSAAVYDTVDSIGVWGRRITVTGIISGQAAPSTFQYPIFEESGGASGTLSDAANRCDRLALLAMSKPGKFQFAMEHPNFSSSFRCALTVRAQ